MTYKVRFEDGSADWFKNDDVQLDEKVQLTEEEEDEARERAEQELKALKSAQEHHSAAAAKEQADTKKAIEEDIKKRQRPDFMESTYVQAPRQTAAPAKDASVDTK